MEYEFQFYNNIINGNKPAYFLSHVVLGDEGINGRGKVEVVCMRRNASGSCESITLSLEHSSNSIDFHLALNTNKRTSSDGRYFIRHRSLRYVWLKALLKETAQSYHGCLSNCESGHDDLVVL